MALCFITPQDTIRVVADVLGRDARRALVGEIVAAWVDGIPDGELSTHYAKAVAGLGEPELGALAQWHGAFATVQPVANTEFLLAAFPALGDARREALKLAAGFRGELAFDAGVTEEHALAAVLPHLSGERAAALAHRCIDLYIADRVGGNN
jgi:hypothetical protein